MVTDRILQVLLASAIVLLVGVPGQARASTVDCTVTALLRPPSGHVDMWAAVDLSDSAYHLSSTTITRGYYDEDGRCYPLQNGFCFFRVPDFEGVATACTLHYYQSAHQNSPSLSVNYMYDVGPTFSWPRDTVPAFWYAWNDTIIIATDVAHTTDGWYAVPLTSQGRQVISDLGSRGGGTLYTGWTYRNLVDGTYADVAGSGSGYEPYIHVVYQ
jgi:hypothetical protein